MMQYSEKDFEAKNYEQLIAMLPSEVQFAIQIMLGELMDALIGAVNGCESPIEELMALGLYEMEQEYRGQPGIEEVVSQAIVDCGRNKYRVDFLITVPYEDKCDTEMLKIIVECDGHDFHEKTKEQAIKDKKRDRDLTRKGYHILRYTGREIWNEFGYLKCAREVFETIADLIMRHNRG